jgi:hypothetical protein
MAHRPPGRPKAHEPRDIKVTIRLTEREADLLVRMANEASLSTIVRHALDHYMHRYGGAANLRDTERALIHRELRKAKRAASPEADALAQVFALDNAPEPSAAPQPSHVPVFNPATGQTGTLQVTHLPDSNAGKTFTVQVTKPSGPDAS